MKHKPIRYFLIVLLLGLQSLMLTAILLATHKNTEVVLRKHAQEVMDYLITSVANSTQSFLESTEQVIWLTHSLVSRGIVDPENDQQLELYLLAQLQTNKQLAGIYLGRYDGSFVFVKREENGFRTKFISKSTSGKRTVEIIFYDETLTLTKQIIDPNDVYDPRKRAWFQAADKANTLIWTDPYIFFTAKLPGITAALPITRPNGIPFGVIGVDIEITGLSAFLQNIPIERNGSAFIQDQNGLAIAFPNISEILEQENRGALPKVFDIGWPVSQALLAEFMKLPPAKQFSRTFLEFESENNLHYGMVSPLKVGHNLRWLLMVQAPAKDFIGDIQVSYRQSLLQILGIGLLFFILAIPLGFSVTRPFAHLHKRATIDQLTGLTNRDEFMQLAKVLLSKLHRKGTPVAVAMLDLDDFKPINDKYGHLIGDEVLNIVAKRLNNSIRTGDLIGRFGGDEFAMILANVSFEETVETVERIRAGVVQRAIHSSAGDHTLGATVGVISAVKALDIFDLIKKADEALLAGKEIGKNHTYLAGQTSFDSNQEVGV